MHDEDFSIITKRLGKVDRSTLDKVFKLMEGLSMEGRILSISSEPNAVSVMLSSAQGDIKFAGEDLSACFAAIAQGPRRRAQGKGIES